MSSPIIWFGNAAKLLKSTLTIPGATSGTFSLSIPASVTSYTVIMPSAQAAGALTNDGSGNLSWSAAGSSVNTVGTYDSQTPAANGLTIAGSNLYAQSATLTVPGMVSTGVQSFAGNKTFSGTISASNLSGSNTGDQTITLTGDVTGSGTGSFAATIAPLAVDNSKIATSAAIALTKLAALTNHNRALQSDASGFITESAVTSTELGYSSGVTSAIQTQLDAKVALAGSTMTGPLVLSGDPTLPNGAANKQYVDNLIQGLSAKQSVLVATTTAGTLATSFAAGQTIDGVVLSLLDRILLKNQAAPAENGIYVVTAGTPTRALDMDTWAEVVGAFTFVEEGTANASSGWVSTAAPGGTIGVTSIVFVQFSQAGSITAGIALTKTGNTLDVNVDNVTIDVSSNQLEVKAGGISNAQVNAAAAITYSKLSLTNSILNADINSAAAIAYSKLNLTGNIVNSDISASAAIDASKIANGSVSSTEFQFLDGVTSSIQTQLDAKQATGNYITALTGDVTASGPGSATATIANNAITDVKVDAAAAIARSKLASGTINQVVINDGSGVLSSEATLAKVRGGSGQDNSSITFPASGILATTAGTQTITNKDIDGGTASNSLRITMPSNTLANLTALTRKAGTMVYATDTGFVYYDNGTTLTQLASGAGTLPSIGGSDAGKSVIVNPASNAYILGTPTATTDTLIESLSSWVATLTAAEAISANDAVALVLHNGSGSSVYRVYKATSVGADKKTSALGFATAAATVTPQISTWTDAGALITGNVVTYSVNGRTYSNPFITSNDATLTAIAASLAGDQDIASAVVTNASPNSRVITITSKGGLSLNIPTPIVTAGASQTTVVIAQTQAASGQNVTIKAYGPMSGFSSLTVGNFYYVGATAGSVTATPADSNPVSMGQAISSSVIYVNRSNIVFGQTGIMVRSHGNAGGNLGAQSLDTEHFNFITWSVATPDTVARAAAAFGQTQLNGTALVIDGAALGGTPTLYTGQYNKAGWASGTTRTTVKIASAASQYNGNLVVGKGQVSGTANNGLDIYNGSTWTNGAATFGQACFNAGAWTQGGFARWAGGTQGSSGVGTHDTWNGTTTGTDTSITTASTYPTAAQSGTGVFGILTGVGGNSTISYRWSGTTWSSSITVTYGSNGDGSASAYAAGAAGAFNNTTGLTYINGGASSTSVSVATSAVFNDTSWSSSVSSNNSRAAANSAFI